MSSKLLRVVVGAAAGLASMPALASETAASASATTSAPAENSAPEEAANSDTALAEIVVTAQKRSESINNVGLTIQAFSQSDLEKNRIENVTDLAKVVPGLAVADSGQGAPVYTLRGVGFYDRSLATYPAVTVYVDEVPLPFPVTTTQAAFDLQRIEVLKGPQGILFGQNSTGGAIDYIAAQPTDTLQYGTDLSYGRFNDVDVRAYVSGPLTDTLSGRIAIKGERADDWQYSYTRPGDTAGKKQVGAVRLLLNWHPFDQLRVAFNFNGFIDHSDPQEAQLSDYVFQYAQFAAPYLAIPLSPENARAANWTPSNPPRGDRKQYQSSLRVDYELAQNITLTSITSYLGWQRNDHFDTDGSPLHSQDTAQSYGKIDSFYQELRVANGSSSSVRWTAGGNFSNDRVTENDIFLFGDATSSQLFHFSLNELQSQQNMKNYAAFGDLDFDVTDQLTLKAGARYTEAKRNYSNCSGLGDDPALDATFTAISRGTDPTFPALGPNECVTIDANTGLAGRTPYLAGLDEHNISWRGGVDYHIASNIMAYGNVTKGFKAGSFFTQASGSTNQLQPVHQESVLAYEAGVKSELLERSLFVNAAAFYYKYDNKQLLATVLDPVFGPLDAVVNIPKSSIKGGEISLIWRATQGLTINGGVTYLHGTVDDYFGLSGIGGSVGTTYKSYAGTPIPFTPRWNGVLAVDYEWPIAAGYTASVGETTSYNGSTYSVVGADPVSFMKSYAVLDVRAGITTPSKQWQFSIYGRNVTDTYYWNNVTRGGADTIDRYTGMPVTYGVSASYHFK